MVFSQTILRSILSFFFLLLVAKSHQSTTDHLSLLNNINTRVNITYSHVICYCYITSNGINNNNIFDR